MSIPSVWIILIIAVGFNQSVVCSYRILCAFPSISRSHFLVFEGLAHGLAEAGHNVTVIGPKGILDPIENYYHIETKMGPMHNTMLEKLNADPGNVFNVFRAIQTCFKFATLQCADIFTNPKVQQVLENDTFDLVIIEAFFGESLIGLGPHFNCPTIMFTSLKAGSFVLGMFNNPLGLSYVSNLFVPFLSPMNFFQRVHNMVNYLMETPLYQMGRWQHEETYKKFFPPPKYPTFQEMMKNVSLLFVAQHFQSDGAQALFPNIIEVGGIHLSDHKRSMPDHLAKWMNESTNGVVYFSLGTVFNLTQIPTQKLVGILDALGKLKENVIFKTDTDRLPVVPPNVRVEKWVPQTAVLQHKHTKMFITHAGMGSITEARYYGVPVLLIPVGIDQFANAMVAEKEGWGLLVPYNDLTGESFYEAMQKVLSNPKYKENVQYASLLFRDRPLTPKQTATFWTEYVIRHKGAKFLIPHSIDLNFFQLNSLDVLGFLAAITLIIFFVLYKAIRLVCSKCCRSKKNKIKLS